MINLCLRELAEIVGGRLRLGAMPPLGGDLEPVGRIVTDRRLIGDGDVFWSNGSALARTQSDAEFAFSRGAAGVLAARRVVPWAGKFCIQVDDVRLALWRAAQAVRKRFTGKLIAIAGDDHRQTTRALVDAILNRGGPVCPHSALVGPCFGVPRGLFDLDPYGEYGVVEMEPVHAEWYATISQFCYPHILIYAGGKPGVDSPGDPIAYAACLPPSVWKVLCGDDQQCRQQSAKLGQRVVWVGQGNGCDVRATDVRVGRTVCAFHVDGLPFRISQWGPGQLPSALLAYGAARILGIPGETIAELFSSVPSFDMSYSVEAVADNLVVRAA